MKLLFFLSFTLLLQYILCIEQESLLPEKRVFLNELSSIKSDESALKYLRKIVETTNAHNATLPIELLEHSIKHGWLNASHFLMSSHFQHHSSDFDLPAEFHRIRRQIKLPQLPVFSNVSSLLPSTSPSLQHIEPCFLWAQNMTHILMKIKFTPKIDVPGFSEMHGVNVSISLPELYVSAYAFSGESPIRFELKIQTYKFMNAHGSKWSETEQGTLFLEILKSPSPYVWRNIHSQLHHNPPNQHIWWEIYRQNKDHFEAGFSLLEDTEIKRELKEDKKFIQEEQRIADKRLIRDTLASQAAAIPQAFRDAMYCTQSHPSEKPSNYIPDPFDWLYWQL